MFLRDHDRSRRDVHVRIVFMDTDCPTLVEVGVKSFRCFCLIQFNLLSDKWVGDV